MNAPLKPNSEVGETLVEVKDLQMHFPIYKGIFRRKVGDVKAVDGLTFDIKRGETLGLVGESGCGKTTCGRALLRLYELSGGHITFEGRDIAELGKEDTSVIKVMFAENQLLAEEQLLAYREKPIVMEHEK